MGGSPSHLAMFGDHWSSASGNMNYLTCHVSLLNHVPANIRLDEDVFKTSSRHLQDVFKTSSRRLQGVFKTSSRCLKDIFKTSCKDIFKTFLRRTIKLNCST